MLNVNSFQKNNEKNKVYATSELYSGKKNKRQNHRINVVFPVICYPYVNIANNQPISFETESINLSTKGICIKANESLLEGIEINSFVIISFKFEEEDTIILCKCKNNDFKNGKLGLEFETVLSTSSYAINPTGFILNKLARFIIGYQLKTKYNKRINFYKSGNQYKK